MTFSKLGAAASSTGAHTHPVTAPERAAVAPSTVAGATRSPAAQRVPVVEDANASTSPTGEAAGDDLPLGDGRRDLAEALIDAGASVTPEGDDALAVVFA